MIRLRQPSNHIHKLEDGVHKQMHEDDIVEIIEKWLCHHCVGEEYLMSEMQRDGQLRQCSYCGRLAQSYGIENVSDRIETAFKHHFRRTPDEPDDWNSNEWERFGEPVLDVIEDAAQIPKLAAEDIQSILEHRHDDFEAAMVGVETEFCSDSHYTQIAPSDYRLQNEWLNFENSLKTEARFFSRISTAHLASIFNGIERISSIDGRPLVIDAGPKTAVKKIYRARVFQSEKKLKEALCHPDIYLGSPPAYAANAGRMNASGISVFYGASDPEVAISEVRPPVGSQVAVACYEIVRSLRLLDLTASETASESGSIFDTKFITRLERAIFLRSLSQRMTKPVMPDDEIFEYLPTQAIADFLATENEPVLDGIVFPSVQALDKFQNIVLFHKASRIEDVDIPEGTDIEVNTGFMTDHGWDPEYSVTEYVKTNKQVKEDTSLKFDGIRRKPKYLSDNRAATLRIDLESINIHVVDSVKFQFSTHKLYRRRVQLDDDKL